MIDEYTRVCGSCAEKAGIQPLKRLRSRAGRTLGGWFFRSGSGAPCTVCGNMIGPSTLEHAKNDKAQQLITVETAEVCTDGE